MDISIIIVAFDAKDLLRDCLLALKRSQDSLHKEILYVDNGSRDATIPFLQKEFPSVRIFRSESNLGFTAANNLAYAYAQGNYILLLNVDAFVGPHTLQRVFTFLEEHPQCGIVGARLRGLDGSLQPSARTFPTPWRMLAGYLGLTRKFPFVGSLRGIDCLDGEHEFVRETDWVPGCFLMLRRSIAESFGYLLRKDLPMYFDDIDICLRFRRKGWKVCFFPDDVVHLGGANSKRVQGVVIVNAMIEHLRIESMYRYYRINYSIAHVLCAWGFSLVFDLVCLIRHLVRWQGASIPAVVLHVLLLTKVFIITRAGARALRT